MRYIEDFEMKNKNVLLAPFYRIIPFFTERTQRRSRLQPNGLAHSIPFNPFYQRVLVVF